MPESYLRYDTDRAPITHMECKSVGSDRLARGRDLLIYASIAIPLVGGWVIVLFKYPDIKQLSSREIWCVTTTLLLGGYLLKAFARRLKEWKFWATWLLLLSIHVLWAMSVPVFLVIVAVGPELVLSGICLHKFLTPRPRRSWL